MFTRNLSRAGISARGLAGQQLRCFTTSKPAQKKVTVIGAAGGIGQPLSLLLKMQKGVTDLRLYDLAPVTPGVAADISHINRPGKVTGFVGESQLPDALADADVVVVPAGVPRKPGMTRDDLFNVNASIVAGVAKAAAKACPKAALLIISNPVNSTVPIVAEVLKREGVYDKRKLFGVTTLDVVRANRFVAENQKMDASKVNVPVIGGHAGITIVPLLSQVPGAKFSQQDKEALTQRIMFGGDEVVKAKAGQGSATLSMAYAGAIFTEYVLRALNGERGIKACAYVESPLVKGIEYFASPVELGPNGVESIPPLPKMDDFETQKFTEMQKELSGSIKKGIEFVQKQN
jgi:malate dehydrogenase